MSDLSRLRVFSRSSPSPAQLSEKAKLQEGYVDELWYLLTAVIGLLTIVHWSTRLYSFLRKPQRGQNNSNATNIEKTSPEASTPGQTGKASIRRLPQAFCSVFKIVAFRTTVPIGPSSVMSVTELVFITGYVIALLVWLWINTHDMEAFYFEDRAAHLASCQVPLIVALAGKNNIISFLTGVSHERLNVLHRASARACLVLLWIHALVRGLSGLPEKFDLSHGWMKWGVAGLAAFSLATVLSVRPIRIKLFEFFLVSHIVLIFIFILGGLIHAGSREFGDYFWPAFLVWGLDRVLRLGRLIWNNRIWTRSSSDAHRASVELLTSDTVKLTLRRRMNWTAGQHAYVILPSVSKLPTEAHPFTIASIPHSISVNGSDESPEKEVVFLIRAQSGFTERLREHASIKGIPSSVPAYIDGPYGNPPDLRSFSTCVLIAGGSGISYTLPLLLDIVHNVREGTSSCQRVLFVWIVHHEDHMNWISKPLTDALLAAPSDLIVEPRIFITRPKTKSSDTLVTDCSVNSTSPYAPLSSETVMTMKELARNAIKTANGRPDVEALIQDAVSLSSGPVSVDVAGPSSLASAVRAATSFENTNPINILKGRPTVTLHMETFGMVKA
ncbi:FRP1_3 [Sanghuangporus weigelae]